MALLVWGVSFYLKDLEKLEVYGVLSQCSQVRFGIGLYMSARRGHPDFPFAFGSSLFSMDACSLVPILLHRPQSMAKITYIPR